MKKKLIFTLLLVFLIAFSVHAKDREVLLREDFNNLENWKPLYFHKIKEHTLYYVVKKENESFLKAKSNSSASALVYKKEFNAYKYPKVRWRWKISNIYKKGNALEKSGDDYPARIYITFKYDSGKAPFGKKIKYSLVKALYGEYPPHSTINYIWANRQHKKNIITNTYAKETKMIILQAGAEKAGKWMEQEVNIIEDYRKAFGSEPPATASIAVMNDSDNTKEGSVLCIDYIEVGK
ncbi:MAG: DUF3047 domain-containing protein [Candidatus Mariimomonas ferrooxydans]